MTEAGQKWVLEHARKDDQPWHPADEAQHWISAFCAEVDRRADTYDDPDAVWMAYEALKRELLGENEESSEQRSPAEP